MDMNIGIGSKNAEKQQLVIVEEDDDGISVPNWLLDVLKWITRMEMANSSLSFSCKMFKQLCWPKLHENVEPHIVPWLEFCYEPNNSGNICGVLKDGHQQIIPIAATPPPEYILGFETFFIRFLDTQVIEFFKNIAFALEGKILLTSVQKWQENDEESMLMHNLLTIFENNIYGLDISNYLEANHFLDFYREFPTFIDQMPFLNVAHAVDLDFDILFNWLIKPLTNGRQKILRYHNHCRIWRQKREMDIRFISRIKEEFLHSTERSNFLVNLDYPYDQFSLQNEQTGEVLNLCHERTPEDGIMFLLARYPKGEEHWKEESEKKIFGEGKRDILLDIHGIKKK